MYLTQRKYCLELLTEFGMLASKPCGSPIETKECIIKPSKGKSVDIDYPLTRINIYQKLGRINAIDADEDITQVNVQDDVDNEMFDVSALNGEEVFVAGQNENVVEEVVDVVQVSTAATTVTITIEEITLAQALKALKTSKPKVKGIVFQESSTTTTTTTISSQQSQDKGKGIMIEEPVKPMKKKRQISFDEEVSL
ncbi:hypothetical protein Tco_1382302 [Tanacetum coccineum]